ncbi:MAG: hypothetical protein U9R34_06945 [Nanoarchaeota archaeon]|nr:hypothetical protein [Nanoarchaeota archaeon]
MEMVIRIIGIKMRNYKKGQFYLFTAIVIIALLAGIIPMSVMPTTDEDVFNELNDNFIEEAVFVINNAIYMNASVKDSIDSFALSFLNYARQRDPNFGFVIMLQNRNETILMNQLKDGNISLQPSGGQVVWLAPGESSVAALYPSFDINMGESQYHFTFAENPEMQLKMLFNSHKNANIYIRELY